MKHVLQKTILWRGKKQVATYMRIQNHLWLHIAGETYLYQPESIESANSSSFSFGPLKSPMPGKVKKVFVKQGDRVEEKSSLLVLEAMKMEYTIKVPAKAKIEQVSCSEGQQVKEGQILMIVNEE